MSVHFSFLEYSYDADTVTADHIALNLRNLGFTCTGRHRTQSHEFWRQRHIVVMLTEHTGITGITGLGFICDDQVIETIKPDYSESRGMFYLTDPSGLKNFLVPLDYYDDNKIANEYVQVPEELVDSLTLDCVSGITHGALTPEIVDHYEKLGFRVTKRGARYHQLTSQNNRFSIMIDAKCNDNCVKNIVTETHDVFLTTAKCHARGLKTKNFQIDQSKLNFGKLNHMIAAYNCKAHGNSESYTIENFLPTALPGLDIIFRMRKQFIDISEHTLKDYYDGCKN
jgi:hypothetical protein